MNLMPRTDILKCPVCGRSFVVRRWYPTGSVCSKACLEVKRRDKAEEELTLFQLR